MTRIRIRCRVPVEQAKPDENGFPILPRAAVNGRVADWTDLEVFAVGVDGAEMPLTNVDRVEFVAQASPEPLRVVVTFLNPEIDVEGVDDDGAAHERLVESIARQFFDDSGDYRGTAADARRSVREMLDELEIVVGARREPSASPPVARLRRDGVWSDLPVGRAGDVWDASRGAWVASPSACQPSYRWDPYAELLDGVAKAIRRQCVHVDGADFDTTTPGEIRISLRGRGVTADEIDAVQSAALGLVPVAMGVVVRRAEA